MLIQLRFRYIKSSPGICMSFSNNCTNDEFLCSHCYCCQHIPACLMLFKQLEQDYVCAYMQHSLPLHSLIPNHKIMEEFGLERTFKGHLVQPLSK